MKYINHAARAAAVSAVLVTLSLSSPLQASQCKGLAVDQCGAQPNCSWVEGYTRSNGKQVSAHCRTKSGGKSKQQSDMSKGAQPAKDKQG
jgi:hypothetical protein